MVREWKNKKVAILGGGLEGIASTQYLSAHGAFVTVLDQREQLDQEAMQKLEELQATFIGGQNYLQGLSAYDVIVRSPGIRRNLPEIVAAEKAGRVITSQTIIFLETCPAPIIGVTGTKGKGTTASLVYEMLKKEGLDVYLGGNIGMPPLMFLDKLTPSSWVVLELSSFQLEDLQKESSPAKASAEVNALANTPHIAVVLMIVPEHLGRDTVGTQNYHDSMEDYVDAKRNILRLQGPNDYAIFNRDYPASHESDVHTGAKIYQVSREREAKGDGCFTRQGRVMLRKDGKEEEIIDTSEILLPGKHNLENVCSAVMAADLAGASRKSIVSVLSTFKGLEHRLELIREVRCVRYYDDSFSTTPETAIAAIEAFDAPEIIILGGSRKNSDFTELGLLLSTRVNIKAVIGIGAEWQRIKQSIKHKVSGIKYFENCKNMQEVVQKAAEVAESGDVVLLSPACASFDMFANYKERGQQFKAAVLAL
jgi:UDP-N-acetylmuramoylalanine--D-glutamate ligase